MNLGPLDPTLLKQVSRSFYLSVRMLPPCLQMPIGIAYLLARASDTIADSSSASPEIRIESLDFFLQAVAGERRTDIAEVQQVIASDDPAEQLLIDHLHEVVAVSQSLDTKDWNDIQRVLRTIVTGQKRDLTQFGTGAEVVALPDADALEEYTYLVAGCVGEFWTRVCFRHLPDCATEPLDRMLALGVRFGKGLQLVNILRDMPSDFTLGRCYLPSTELQAAAVPLELLNTCPAGFRRVHDRWLATARGWLESGRTYVRALRRRRVRMACFLPFALGQDTLDLLDATPAFEQATVPKVTRAAVRKRLWDAVAVGLGCGPDA
jgi:farnesyl-diphosphate farnesyltransferase